MARKANPLVPVPVVVSKCDFCERKPVWKNGKVSVCLKHYDEKIYPLVPANAARIAFEKRFREVNEWIGKHPEFKTKEEVCRKLLEKKGLAETLPEKLR